jgi:hypothetical protein
MMFAACEPAEDDPIDPNAPAFTAFSILGQSASINAQDKTVAITVACGTNIAALTPEFTLSPEGATATANGKTQTSGTTAVNCSEPVTYTLTTADGTATAEWTVTVKLPDDCPEATVVQFVSIEDMTSGWSINGDAGNARLGLLLDKPIALMTGDVTSSVGEVFLVQNSSGDGVSWHVLITGLIPSQPQEVTFTIKKNKYIFEPSSRKVTVTPLPLPEEE